MKPIKQDCGCRACGQCKGAKQILDPEKLKAMKYEYITCPSCEGKDDFAKCFEHIKQFLDDDDIKRHQQYAAK